MTPGNQDQSGFQRKGVLRYVAACEAHAWTIVTWRKDAPTKRYPRCFTCRSWRHPGECRRWKGAQDFERIYAGLKKYSGWLYIVLTHDRKKWDLDLETMWRLDGTCWNRLRSRLTRNYGRTQYLCVMERHRISRQPHSNIVIHNERMLQYCSTPDCPHVETVECRPCHACRGNGYRVRLCLGYRKLRQEVKRMAEACGYGTVIWLEPLRDMLAMAGYLQKLSDVLIGDRRQDIAKELVGGAKKGPRITQIPEDAPHHFRRLRPSRGLLPPPHKNPDYTGELVSEMLEVVETKLAQQGLLQQEETGVGSLV